MDDKLTPAEQSEVRSISDRIAKVEMARALTAAGKPVKALEILKKLRYAYDEHAKRKLVEHLIAEAEMAATKMPR